MVATTVSSWDQSRVATMAKSLESQKAQTTDQNSERRKVVPMVNCYVCCLDSGLAYYLVSMMEKMTASSLVLPTAATRGEC